ncbi:Inner membrane protein yghQ [Fusobacterium necrogenes]|uniref:Inner membrane protein yghQ n=1 Tax=Fusobacterium necrogenes TaxID=858 RepID=A0A377GXE8_9FUSO|nr:lipopolysaccharide biosynthesis protein [Fusobacterium necrogenes]STO31284.1 Inner membrane protein yghQ [Fusobacterium necrogenes]
MIKKLKYLLSDKLLVNFLHLFGGDAFASILSIFSISFITKGIGLEKYGLITLIQGVVSLIDGIFNFQSWQGIIKFYPEVREDEKKLKTLIKFSYFLDFSTAIIAFIVFFSLSTWIAKFYNFQSQEFYFLLVFSIYIIFNIQGTGLGILRSFNRFDYLRNQRMLVAIFNFLFLGLGFILKQDIFYFLLVYLFTNILNSLILNYFVFKELKRRKITGIFKEKLKFNKEFFKFTCLTNINSSLDIPVQYFDNLMIGKLLSLEQLAVYKLCKTLTVVLDRVATPLYQTLYPYFCERIVEKSYSEIFRKCIKISSMLLMSCIFLVFVMNIIGFDILSNFFSKSLNKYKLELNLYLLMKSLATVFIFIHPLFLALGYIKRETKIVFIANFLYLAILFILIKKIGLIGVIIAYGIQVFLIVMMKGIVILKSLKIK